MPKKSLNVLLLVEDNPGDARLLREMLKEHDSREFQLTHVDRMTEAENHLAKGGFDLILLDLGLPDSESLSAVRRV